MTTKAEITVSATEFKARCLALMDTVHDSGRSVLITKHGKPVARMVPLAKPGGAFFGSLPVTINGDIVGPIEEQWDAER
jgi:prevent-host-death family protein